MQETNAVFQKIKKNALDHVQRFYDGSKPVIMVGTATCGRAAGSLEVLRAMREELDKDLVDAVVLEVGCMGHCYAEPLVIINKPGHPAMAYGYVTPEIARRLVRDYVLGEDPSLEFTLGALEENDLIPSIYDLPRFAYEKQIILEKCGHINPEDVEQYIVRGGYEALDKEVKRKLNLLRGEHVTVREWSQAAPDVYVGKRVVAGKLLSWGCGLWQIGSWVGFHDSAVVGVDEKYSVVYLTPEVIETIKRVYGGAS